MSIAELPSGPSREAGLRGRDSGGDRAFDRTPPQDVAAEQSVLGAMLLSKDAIADVVEVLRGPDFYQPAHELVYEAVLDLYGRGEPADAVTVVAELQKRGELGRIGGAPYVHTLLSTVPTAANAAYYAQIVRERAVLRRLVEAGTRIVQMGYAADGGEADDIVDRAQAEIYQVTERRTSEDYAPLADIMEGTLDEIEAIGSRGGQLVGVPTGFVDLDQLTNGLHPGQMVVVAARPAVGKALALDTPLPTPTGWTTMGEVASGDYLLGANGRATRVLAATEVMYGRACYEVMFSDGSRIVADGQHQWLTETRAAPTSAPAWAARSTGSRDGPTIPAIMTTREIAGTLRRDATDAADAAPNRAVANAQPLDLPERELPLPPYVLGVWLGVWLGGGSGAGSDACRASHVTTVDREILTTDRAHGIRVGSRADRLLSYLRPLPSPALPGRIPTAYLRASEAQRRGLLAGLMDAGGSVTSNGELQFRTTAWRLAEDVVELVASLGYRCSVTSTRVPGGTGAPATAYLVNFPASDDVFRLARKRLVQRQRRRGASARWERSRIITGVRAVPPVPVRCVQVDAPDHLYLAGRSFIPTHNSTLGLDVARSAAIKHGLTAVIFSLEMGRSEITMRLLSAEARVPLHHMRSGTMSEDDWNRLARRIGEVSAAPLFIDDSPNMSMMEIRAKCRRLKQRQDLKLVVIDYLQLMTSGKRVESRQQEVSEFSRAIKLLAKELDVPVVAISQLNRGSEQRTDKRPQLSDLRESGCLTEDTALLRADTGAPVTFRRLLEDGHDGVLVWSLDEDRRLVPAPIVNVFPSGVKPVYRLRLGSGREVEATGNHPFLTLAGWAPLETLAVGNSIAVPRRTPEPLTAGIGWSEHRLGLLAHLLGDGCDVRTEAVRYTTDDEASVAFVETAAAAEFGTTARRVRHGNRWHVYLSAPHGCTDGRFDQVRAWLRGLGIENRRSHEKCIPDALHSANNAEIAVFLRHLWATDGGVTAPAHGATTSPQICYAATSRRMAEGVMLLLSRFGIIARVATVHEVGYRTSYHVVVADRPSLRVFAREIRGHGNRGRITVRPPDQLEERARTSVDARPAEASDQMRSEWIEPPSSDVAWDRIAAIEPLGERPVYDATVKGTHNFVANGVVAHNSIEQDADMVILLHREEMYERESPRAGEADFIVAKHRNGPTTTITVAFQGHYSRFVDMAQM